MKKNLALTLCLYMAVSCNQRNNTPNLNQTPATAEMKMIRAAEDSLEKIKKMMEDTGMHTGKKMDMMQREAKLMENGTRVLMNDSTMWMDTEMKKIQDSIGSLTAKMGNKPASESDMKMMKEKTELLRKQWQKVKTMKAEMEKMNTIATDKMDAKNR